ncbi:hypothetical protein [Streptomyces sp. NPDC056491]|uniref:hypothetical protein n=1 Tax=Streptomyces sp. NPDC056491 TaxID=3345837 RepID=UPI0036A7D2AC
MTHPFRTRRLALFAASTAIAAGGVLVPTTAFAATPAAAPHTTAADSDDDDGNRSNLLLVVPPGSEGTIKVTPDSENTTTEGAVRWGVGTEWPGILGNRPGKGGTDDRITVAPGKPSQWQCITAPCGPPDGIGTLTYQEPHNPAVAKTQDTAGQAGL